MSSSQWQSQVVPARLSFLAIYNPSLGPTDETFQDQLVFHHSLTAQETRAAAKHGARNDAAGGEALRQAENEKLRQIGLAQGMVDFARSFSDGQPVESIDTEKSRIVLHELEPGWWILASIDLTRLPAVVHGQSETTKKGNEKAEGKPLVEYSSREVSPPALLLQQLLEAHYVFALHHGPSLTELFVRLTRDKFLGTLERYWTRFSQTWDVLLHGNPASDIFGAIKLSTGGELGISVGEEEWGSAEREVLEDLTRRTEGLVDLVVSRFGDPTSYEDGEALETGQRETVPWLGTGSHPMASDGVIFGGINAIGKTSLRDVSLWMRHIYTFGNHTYGVRDNPHRERKKRRRRNLRTPEPESGQESERGGTKASLTHKASGNPNPTAGHLQKRAPQDRTASRPGAYDLESSRATTQGADYPGIPPPIVTATEESLNRATRHADASSGGSNNPPVLDDSGTTLGIPDQYMKYLTFGLSTLAKSNLPKRPEGPRRISTSSSNTLRPSRIQDIEDTDDELAEMGHAEPMPDGELLQHKFKMLKQQETRGHFVIGLQGDLDDLPGTVQLHATGNSSHDDLDEPRIVVRTIQLEVRPKVVNSEAEASLQRKLDDPELMPSNEFTSHFRRLRVLIYVRRPFMYCFLFEQRAPSLAMGDFYKTLHHTLSPIHKPLLMSTSRAKIIQRIEETQISTATSDSASIKSGSKTSSKTSETAPIYDLIHDPALLTVHTSIPNIPEPGTPAAEGIVTDKADTGMPSWPAWTRIEALNVHSRILNTISSTKHKKHEYEQTSKTSRGWWVVWLKLPPSVDYGTPKSPMPLMNEPNQIASPSSGSNDANSRPTAPPMVHAYSDETLASSTFSARAPATPRAPPPDFHRIALLVRKASDTPSAPKSTASSRAVSSMWNSLSLRSGALADESTGGASAGWGPAALAGGIGVDARKYIEGLLSLNR